MMSLKLFYNFMVRFQTVLNRHLASENDLTQVKEIAIIGKRQVQKSPFVYRNVLNYYCYNSGLNS